MSPMGNLCKKDDSVKNTAKVNFSNSKGKQIGHRSGGNVLGGEGVTSTHDAAARRRAVAAAAEKRAMAGQGGGNVGGSSGTDRDRARRDELVGRIEALYQAAKKDPPFGLRAANIATLKKHLKVARNL